MRIERLEVYTFPVPFRTVFRHASAKRGRAQNLIVLAHADNGQSGCGEGCPRQYVTGETLASGSAFITAHAGSLVAEVSDVASLRAWIEAHRGVIDRNPAAFCALEIAILDLIGKGEGQTIEQLIGGFRLNGSFTYSAVLGDAPYPLYRWQLMRYRRLGLQDIKVKVSGDKRRDRRKLLALELNDPHMRVRLDANNLWTSVDACVNHLSVLPDIAFAIEEPLRIGDLDGFRMVGEACGIRIVLDESVLRSDQLEELMDTERWIVNLRVSKMGGILRSLAVAKQATRMGIGVIVGCQVGETSILARAALPVMQALGSNLIAAEGAFGTYLLRQDLTSPSLMFGQAGALAAAQVPDTGFGGLGLALTNPGRDLQRLG